jgi:hypothetical protein
MEAALWKKTLPNKGDGWKVRVWNNVGWHWALESDRLSVRPSYFRDKIMFFCLISEDDKTMKGGGRGCWSSAGKSHADTPWEAVRKAAEYVFMYMKREREILNSIEHRLKEIGIEPPPSDPPKLRPRKSVPA